MCTYAYKCSSLYVYIRWYACIHVLITYLLVSFAEYRLFYRALLQKRPIILHTLVCMYACTFECMHTWKITFVSIYICMYIRMYLCMNLNVYIYWLIHTKKHQTPCRTELQTSQTCNFFGHVKNVHFFYCKPVTNQSDLFFSNCKPARPIDFIDQSVSWFVPLLWVLYHFTGFAQLVWGRSKCSRSFLIQIGFFDESMSTFLEFRNVCNARQFFSCCTIQ